MGNCLNQPPEIVMKQYWESLPIRQITPSLYKEFIRREIKPNTPLNMSLIAKSLLSPQLLLTSSDKFDKVTSTLFLNFFERNRGDYKLAILSLIFLTTPTNSTELFISMRQIIKHLDIDFFKTINNIEYVEKRKLEKLLIIYVNLISLFSISYVKNLQDDYDFVFHLTEEYQFNYIENYVNDLLDHFINDNILFSKFLDNYMDKLGNDLVIREGLHRLHAEDLEGSMFVTPGYRSY
jgi:hypothetical protein